MMHVNPIDLCLGLVGRAGPALLAAAMALACLAAPSLLLAAPLERFEAVQPHMGTTVEIVVYAPDERTAARAIAAGYARVRQLNRILSDYDPESELSRLSRASPTPAPVAVSDDLWRILIEAQKWSERSQGAFDATVGPLSVLWRGARKTGQAPTDDDLAKARSAVGWRSLRLHPSSQSVELLAANMRLDLGGIAKGYVADEALAAMRALGVTRALVNAGGDVSLGEPPPDARGWRIGVAPLAPKSPPSRFLVLANGAVATSGDAWQHVEIGGRRHSHILDPRSGAPLSERSSVTVVARDGAAADALASAVSVLGSRDGLKLIDDTPGAEALVVSIAEDGAPQVHASRGWAMLESSAKKSAAPIDSP